jgi:acetolactate synthase-1/2/3 large subunit
MKYSDFFCLSLKNLGYTHCFALQGGPIMHLINSANKYFKLTSFLHENSAAIAADYFNASNTNQKAWVLVTSGPGLTNSVTGIANAFLESRELLIVSGQCKLNDLLLNRRFNLRQTGHQQIDGVSIVKKITKFSKTFLKTEKFNFIRKYVNLSSEGRKGPVFFEIPIDIQAKVINTDLHLLKKKISNKVLLNGNLSHKRLNKVNKLIKSSNRTSILLGSGISKTKFEKIKKKLFNNDFAFFTTWNGADLLSHKFKKNFGRPNTWGQRYSNVIIQQSDLLIAIGTRLGMQQTGFNYKSFIPNGKIIHVDIDKKELFKKNPKTNLKINCDANLFLKILSKQKFKKNPKWLKFCNHVKKELPVIETNNTGKKFISPYYFYDKISDLIPKKANLVPSSSGGSFTTFMQTFKFKNKQMCRSSKGLASMGVGLAGSIGVALARKKEKTFLFEGDGGFAQNFQEIGTAIYNKLNLKIFIFDDNGYASIRLTQKNYFNGKYVGCDQTTGLIFPNWVKFFNSYNLKTFIIRKHFERNKKFLKLFYKKEIVIFLVKIDPEQTYFPKITSFLNKKNGMISNPIHLMTPEIENKKIKNILKYI